MAARWLMAATLGMALAGCNPLPRPDYVDVKQPASYRTEPGGTRVELDGACLEGEQRVVAAAADAAARVEVGAALADDDLAGVDELAAVPLDAEPLGVGVAAVPGGTAALGLRHVSPSRCR